MKTLKQILEVYSPKSADEKRFVNKHITIKHADRNGNGDDVFTASNVKTIDRAKEKKGHDAKASEAVYESYDVMLIDEARTSAAYQFTHKPGDPESEKKLADLKAQHKGSSNRVVLKGRLGKDNPNAQKYKDAAKANKGRGYGAHAYQTIKKSDAAHHDVYVYKKSNEGLETVEEGSVGQILTPKGRKQLMAASPGKKNYFKDTIRTKEGSTTHHGYYDDKGERHVTHVTKEEVEQIDELSKSTLGSYIKKAVGGTKGVASNAYTAGDSNKDLDTRTKGYSKAVKRINGVEKATNRLTKEEVEVNEVLKVSHGAGAWIKDFQDSENPKFAGKSKEQRKQQALAAFYAAKRAGKE